MFTSKMHNSNFIAGCKGIRKKGRNVSDRYARMRIARSKVTTFGSVSTKVPKGAARHGTRKDAASEPICHQASSEGNGNIYRSCCRRVAGGLFHGRGTGKADYDQQS